MKTTQTQTLNGSSSYDDSNVKREMQFWLPFTLNDCDQTYGSCGTNHSHPTEYPPGSSGKIEVMRQRWEAGLPLFVAGDNTQSLLHCDTHRSYLPNETVIQDAHRALDAKLKAKRTHAPNA